ncbi:hypothetical protein P3X46_007793 [Hevea brasiliensis]|uniref:CRC domain-containing protein n=1 Tax=Hevea brasiliensis TaxID=3981 RepID=A0ABQ9MVM0_HEVBR|nr:hypothetical protein P3X46_007793 [Hevea brasiliensis]
MDSPQSANTATSTTANVIAATFSDSSPVQESPFSHYISNLSPIKPLEAAHVAQGFLGVNSPLVFTSPRTIPNRETSFFQSLSKNLGESVTCCNKFITGTHRDNDAGNSATDQLGSSSGCVDEYLYDPMDVDGATFVNLVNPSAKQYDVLQSSAEMDVSQALFEQPEQGLQWQSRFEVKPAHVVQAHEYYSEKVGASFQGAIRNIAHCESEASQLQRGLSRRCLQFEETRWKTTNSIPSPILINNVTGSGSPASAMELESLDSSLVDLTDSLNKKQMVNQSQPTSMFPPRRSEKSPIVVSKPSGIGLHLNSIVNTLPVGHTETASIKSSNCSRLSNLVENVAITPKDRMLETNASLAASAATAESFHIEEPVNMSQPIEHQSTPLNKAKYCDYFAAGIYCAEPCACQGCFNRPEYEDTVLEARQQIESRNPLAFAPKVVQDVHEFAAEDGNQSIPSLARLMYILLVLCEGLQETLDYKYGMTEEMVSYRVSDERSDDFSILPSYAKSIRSSMNSHSNNMIPEKNQGLGYNVAEMMDQFSPRCNTFADICDLTPLQNPSMARASSASSKTRDAAGGSRLQLCPGSGHFSSGRSLRWRSSPITPMTRLGESEAKNQGHDIDSGLYDILEDDTTEILKEAAIPTTSVKASSPNKKRVSPPHKHIHDLRSNSSGGLKSGRKFILKAVPSFPPLTPCIDSKGSTDEKQ